MYWTMKEALKKSQTWKLGFEPRHRKLDYRKSCYQRCRHRKYVTQRPEDQKRGQVLENNNIVTRVISLLIESWEQMDGRVE